MDLNDQIEDVIEILIEKKTNMEVLNYLIPFRLFISPIWQVLYSLLRIKKKDQVLSRLLKEK